MNCEMMLLDVTNIDTYVLHIYRMEDVHWAVRVAQW
jgi:hypothetical protein